MTPVEGQIIYQVILGQNPYAPLPLFILFIYTSLSEFRSSSCVCGKEALHLLELLKNPGSSEGHS